MNQNDAHRPSSRRAFVRRAGTFTLAVVAAPSLVACGGAPRCDDPAALDADAAEKRAQQNYVERAPDQTKRCDRCTFFTAGATPEACGPCQLGLGSVNPKGTCDQFNLRMAGA